MAMPALTWTRMTTRLTTSWRLGSRPAAERRRGRARHRLARVACPSVLASAGPAATLSPLVLPSPLAPSRRKRRRRACGLRSLRGSYPAGRSARQPHPPSGRSRSSGRHRRRRRLRGSAAPPRPRSRSSARSSSSDDLLSFLFSAYLLFPICSVICEARAAVCSRPYGVSCMSDVYKCLMMPGASKSSPSSVVRRCYAVLGATRQVPRGRPTRCRVRGP